MSCCQPTQSTKSILCLLAMALPIGSGNHDDVLGSPWSFSIRLDFDMDVWNWQKCWPFHYRLNILLLHFIPIFTIPNDVVWSRMLLFLLEFFLIFCIEASDMRCSIPLLFWMSRTALKPQWAWSKPEWWSSWATSLQIQL